MTVLAERILHGVDEGGADHDAIGSFGDLARLGRGLDSKAYSDWQRSMALETRDVPPPYRDRGPWFR